MLLIEGSFLQKRFPDVIFRLIKRTNDLSYSAIFIPKFDHQIKIVEEWLRSVLGSGTVIIK